MPQLTIEQAFQIAAGHHRAGQLPHAEQLYRQILTYRPDHAGALHHLGLIAHQAGRNDSAVDLIRRAIALEPGDSEAYYNLGIALQALGQHEQAVAANRQAIALRPDSSDAHRNLGVALKSTGQLDEAIAAYHRAIALNPNDAETHSNVAIALADRGQIDEAIAAHRRAVALDPNSREIGSNFILAMHYHPGLDAQTIAGEHQCWSRKHAEPLGKFIQPHANDRSPGRRLRIGYVSPDFKHHAVAPMVLPLLACHDREKFQVFCYAQVRKPDTMTERFRAQADQWRSTVDLSDEQMAALIRQDQIDILVDLAGHTAGGRLLVFARKPAPVQIARQGYPDTTGLSTMDYRMTDALADPPGVADTLHSERLIRLPRTNWIYQPPEHCPAPRLGSAQAPDDRLAGAPVTFACFNSFAKVTEPMLLLWGRILRAVPDSRLLLKASGLGSQRTQQRVRELLTKEGLDPARLELRGVEPDYGAHMALYNRVDIALDPFPYHGTTTTCEALWMGVPVITLAGQTHVSRVGVSLLTNMGLAELVAASPEAYKTIAVELAHDLPRLRSLHSSLRQRMEQSPLMDAPRFAREIEAFYGQAWRQWCAGLAQ